MTTKGTHLGTSVLPQLSVGASPTSWKSADQQNVQNGFAIQSIPQNVNIQNDALQASQSNNTGFQGYDTGYTITPGKTFMIQGSQFDQSTYHQVPQQVQSMQLQPQMQQQQHVQPIRQPIQQHIQQQVQQQVQQQHRYQLQQQQLQQKQQQQQQQLSLFNKIQQQQQQQYQQQLMQEQQQQQQQQQQIQQQQQMQQIQQQQQQQLIQQQKMIRPNTVVQAYNGTMVRPQMMTAYQQPRQGIMYVSGVQVQQASSPGPAATPQRQSYVHILPAVPQTSTFASTVQLPQGHRATPPHGLVAGMGGTLRQPKIEMPTDVASEVTVVDSSVMVVNGGCVDSTTRLKNEDGTMREDGESEMDDELVSSSKMDQMITESLMALETFGGLQVDSSTPGEGKKSAKKKHGTTYVFEKMMAMGDEEDRKDFLTKLFAFMEESGSPLNTLPLICKHTIDLYKLYRVVKERGGLQEVSKTKKWREISQLLGQGASSSAGFAVKRNYCKYLLSYECKYDRGGIDPKPILIAMELAIKKDNRRPSKHHNTEAAAADETDDVSDTGSTVTSLRSIQPHPGTTITSVGDLSNTSIRLTQIDSHTPGTLAPGCITTFKLLPARVIRMNPDQLIGRTTDTVVVSNCQINTNGHLVVSPGTSQLLEQSKIAAQPDSTSSSLKETMSGRSNHIDALLDDQRSSSSQSGTSAKRLDFQQVDVSSAVLPPPRREFVFPHGSVETTRPVSSKKRRLAQKHLGPVELSRVLKSLKSGLLSECTWALDALAVLSRDEVNPCSLSDAPGLIHIIIEHIKQCLHAIPPFHQTLSELRCSPQRDIKPTITPVKLELDVNRVLFGDTVDAMEIDIGVKPELPDYTNVTRQGVGVIHAEAVDMDVRRLGEDDDDFDDVFAESEKRARRYVVGNFYANSGSAFEREQFFGDRYSQMTMTELLSDAFQNPIDDRFGVDMDTAADVAELAVMKSVDTPATHWIKKEIERRDYLSEGISKKDISFTSPSAVKSEEDGLFTTAQIDSLKADCHHLHDDFYRPDEHVFTPLNETEIELSRRCLSLWCILRNASFVSINVPLLAKNATLIRLLGAILSLHQPRLGHDADNWLQTLVTLREHCLVLCTNIAGHLDLAAFPDEVCAPLLGALLHWVLASSADAVDSLPGIRLSCQRLALEALAKICVTESNVDLVLATRPYSRIVLLLTRLIDLFRDGHLQVIREFALGLLSRLVRGDVAVARAASLYRPALPLLLEFIECAEQTARRVTSEQGIDALQENPETMGTSLSMLTRAALTLRRLIEASHSRPLRFQQRLLNLVLSPILDCHVTAILADALGVYNSKTVKIAATVVAHAGGCT